MIFSFYDTVTLFFIYSFLGWCVEVAFVAVTSGKVVNRGFLNGPVCPIYGIGMTGILMALTPLQEYWIILFFGAVVICSVIELFGGWILDKLFHMRWWDYSDKPFNIGGYICLEFSIMWGLGGMIMVKMIHPSIYKAISKIPHIVGLVLMLVFTIAFVADMIVTLKTVIGLKKSLGQIEKIAEGLHNIGDQLKDVVGNSAIMAVEKAEESKEKANEGREKITEAYESNKEKFTEVYAANKEKLAEAYESNKDKLTEAYASNKEKITEVYGDKVEDLKKQKAEMEERYAVLLEKLQKQSKRQIKAFPMFKISGSKENLKDKINTLRRK